MPDGTSISVWFNEEEREELLEPLDALPGNRSDHLKRAAKVYLGIWDAMQDLDLVEDTSDHDMRAWVHAMLIEHERRFDPEWVARKMRDR